MLSNNEAADVLLAVAEDAHHNGDLVPMDRRALMGICRDMAAYLSFDAFAPKPADPQRIAVVFASYINDYINGDINSDYNKFSGKAKEHRARLAERLGREVTTK